MLNKIANISSGLDLHKTVKFKQYKKNSSGSFHDHLNVNDSINISPALVNFEDDGWKLRNINKTPDDKINLEFSIDDFDFKIVVDVHSLNSISFLKYSVHKINEISINKNLIQADLLVELRQRLDINQYDSLSMLEVLFSRISRLNLTTELTRNDTKNLNELLDNIQLGLYNEFEAISSVVLNFLQKYTGIDIELKNKSEILIENNIAIDRIKIIHA